MKAKKLLISIALILLSVSAQAYDFSVTTGAGYVNSYTIYYDITSSTEPYYGTVTVTNSTLYANGGPYKYVTIPASVTYSGRIYAVTSIGYQAFATCSNLKSLTIPSSVTSIGDYAFSGTGLTSLTIPSSVTSIGNGAFAGTGLTSLTIPNLVTSIGDYTFYECYGLTKLTIPSSVTSIGDYAFLRCSGLTTVTIPSSVTSIGNSAFASCSGLTKLTIPNSVTSIGNSAFASCSGLTAVTIPNSVTSIGDRVFDRCWELTAVTIPNSVTSIGYSAFWGCGLTAVIIPNSVTSIGSQAFAGCRGLTAVTIPESVTEINDAFLGCSGLTALTIPSSVTSIGFQAFAGCMGLTELTIPESVTEIGDGAFADCTGLTTVTIPESVTSIGYQAFGNCSNLAAINVDTNNSNYSSIDGVLFNKLRNELIRCPAGKTGNYTIPSSVTSIGSSAFAGWTGLTELTIPESVTEIGDYAFSGCTGLTELTIPESVTSIGDGAFVGCTGLMELTIPESVTEIGWEAFYNCTGLTTVNFNAINCMLMGSYPVLAFSGCTALTTLNIGNSVTTIPANAFSGCTGLKDIVLEDGPAALSLESDAFKNCPVESVYLGRNISSSPFRNKTALTALTIGNSVTSIERFAFSGCINVMGINSLNPTPPDVADNTAFEGIDKDVCTLYVPVGSRATYSEHPVWGEFSHILQPQTLTFPDIPAQIYGNPNITMGAYSDAELDITYTSSNPDVATVTGNTVQLHHAGSAQITAAQGGNTEYGAVSVSRTLVVNKVPLTVAVNNASRVYGDENPVFTFSYSGFKNDDTPDDIDALPEVTTSATRNSVVGTYTLTAENASDNNYEFTYAEGQLEISKASLTATVNGASREYGDDNPVFTFSYSGFKNDDDENDLDVPPAATTPATKNSAVGNYDLTAGDASDANYEFSYVQGLLEISKAPLTVTVDNASREYGEANPEFTFSPYSGFKNGETDAVVLQAPQAVSEATPTSAADTYPITISGGDAQNYTFVCDTGYLIVLKAPLTVALNDTVRLYGDENPDFTFSYLDSDFKNGDTEVAVSAAPQAVTEATPSDTVGIYPITISGGDAQNYTFVCDTGYLTVLKAPLTVAVNDTSRLYGDANPDFTLSYNGFKNDDDENSLDILPSIGCAAEANSPVGPYGIVLSDGSDNNYEYILVNGTLEILPGTSVERIETQSLQVYPNPAKDRITVSGEETITTVELIDLAGKTLLLKQVNDTYAELSIGGYPKGSYLLRITTLKGDTVRMVIIDN